MNIHNASDNRRSRFLNLFTKALKTAGGNPILIEGDFNSLHTSWGYKHSYVEGQNLWQDTLDLELTLITDPDFPTCLGTSITRDTTPNLTFVKNTENVHWRNTQHYLGSDHTILEITFPGLTACKTIKNDFAWTDWEAFRKLRTAKAANTQIADLEL